MLRIWHIMAVVSAVSLALGSSSAGCSASGLALAYLAGGLTILVLADVISGLMGGPTGWTARDAVLVVLSWAVLPIAWHVSGRRADARASRLERER